MSFVYLGQIIDEPSDQCETIGNRVEFACSIRDGDAQWHRDRGGETTPISFGGSAFELEHSIIVDETDTERRKFNLVIERMTEQMVGDKYTCEAGGGQSRQASLSEKGKNIPTTCSMFPAVIVTDLFSCWLGFSCWKSIKNN